MDLKKLFDVLYDFFLQIGERENHLIKALSHLHYYIIDLLEISTKNNNSALKNTQTHTHMKPSDKTYCIIYVYTKINILNSATKRNKNNTWAFKH